MRNGLASETASFGIDLSVGHLRDVTFRWQGREIAPLHRAPWVDAADYTVPLDAPPVEGRLSGDFLCAPFAKADLEPAPPHGWTANSAWIQIDSDHTTGRYVLEKTVMGARVEKLISCAADAPMLYQRHRFVGGEGSLPVSHHVMTQMANGGRVFRSPKICALTPRQPADPGLNYLACPATSTDLSAFPALNGTADLGQFPLADRHEDLVGLVEAHPKGLGWTAVMRKAEDDILFVLKNASQLPVTMHWYSHGARQDPPWNGRHKGVLGIEDAVSGIHSGHRAALLPNRVSAMGVPSALELTGDKSIGLVIGAIGRPENWHSIDNISAIGSVLRITSGSEHTELPFRADFWKV